MRYPKSREGMVQLIIDALCREKTTYVSFCKELDEAEKEHLPAKGVNSSFCNSQCAIHHVHNSEQLLCIPFSALKLLKEKGKQNINSSADEKSRIEKVK